eukprot:5789571-Prymnesium_polylepis.1
MARRRALAALLLTGTTTVAAVRHATLPCLTTARSHPLRAPLPCMQDDELGSEELDDDQLDELGRQARRARARKKDPAREPRQLTLCPFPCARACSCDLWGRVHGTRSAGARRREHAGAAAGRAPSSCGGRSG